MKLYPLKLSAFVSQTVWGGRRLIDEYNIKTDKENAAEAWVMSAHKNGTSTVANGELKGKTLRQLYSEYPQIGGKNCEGFKDFPVLIKFIDAAANLSVQVHPDDAYCEKKGEGAGKTESWYILDCEEDAYLLLGFEKEISKQQFEEAIRSNTLTDYVKKVPVKKGDFFFIPSGTLHAICKGIVLAEVQQNSDTTYRIYDYGRMGLDGKPRQLHIEDSINVTNLTVYKNPCTPKKMGDRLELASCPFFKENVFTTASPVKGIADEKSFVSLLILEGEGKLYCAGEELLLEKGDSIFIPAGCGEYTVSGKVKVLETTI